MQGLTLEVVPGLGGYFRVGLWTPLRVTLDNKGPSFSGMVELVLLQGGLLAERKSTVTYKKRVYLPEYTRASFTINTNLGNTPRPILAQLRSDDGAVLLSTEVSVRRSMTVAPVVLVVGSNSGYEQLVGAGPGMVSRKVAYVEARDVPSAWLTLQGISMVVVHGVRNLDLDASQLAALTQWIHTGGRLIVADGTGERPTQALAASLLPVFIDGSTTALTETTSAAIQPPTGAYVSENMRKPGAHSPWRTIDTSLLGSTWVQGEGQVTYLPWDPLGRAFGSWPVSKRLWEPLLPPLDTGLTSPTPSRDDGEGSEMRLGPAMGTIYRSRWTVLVFCGVYVAGLRLLLRASTVRDGAGEAVSGAFWPLAGLQALVFATVGLLALGMPGLVRNTGLSEISLLLGRPDGRYVAVNSYVNGFSPRQGTFNMTYRPDVQGLVQTSRYGASWPDATYSLDETYSTIQIHLKRWEGFDLISSSVCPSPIRVEGPVPILKAGRSFRRYTLTNLASQPITDAAVAFEETTLNLNDMKPFERRMVTVPARSSSTEMVPVVDSAVLAAGSGLSQEESANRTKALDAAAESYHATGPAFVGWLRRPVWDFVKYGGLRIRTSVGLVMMPLNVPMAQDIGDDTLEEGETL